MTAPLVPVIFVTENPFAGFYPEIGEFPTAPHVRRFPWRPWWFMLGGGVFRHCRGLVTVCRSSGGYLARGYQDGRDVEIVRFSSGDVDEKCAAGVPRIGQAWGFGDELLACVDEILNEPRPRELPGQVGIYIPDVRGLRMRTTWRCGAVDRTASFDADSIALAWGPGAPWGLPGLRFALHPARAAEGQEGATPSQESREAD